MTCGFPLGTIDLTLLWCLSAIIASVVAMAVVMVGLVRRGRGRHASSCGKCGYNVEGLPTFTCPECGSDLRKVGITSAPAANPLVLLISALGSAWKRLAVWTLFYAALFPIMVYLWSACLLLHDVSPVNELVLEPASKAYRLVVNQTGRKWESSGWANVRSPMKKPEKLLLQLGGPGQALDYNTWFDIDLTNWNYRLFHWVNGRSPDVQPVNFNRGELERFFKEKKIDTASPAVAAELDAVMLMIEKSRTLPLPEALGAAGPLLKILSAKDKTAVTISVRAAGRGGAALPILDIGAGCWALTMTGVIIRRMNLLSHRAPNSSIEPTAPVAGNGQVARTVTVLFSDIKDYTSRTAAASRAGAIELVRRHRDLAGPLLRQRRGTVVKTIGDALLVTFESATDAALAGLEIQAAVAKHNAGAVQGDTLQLRIAVATGDVIVEAGDVYGETVNLAARLQNVALPGQVVMSAATRALVNAREVSVEPAGAVSLAGFREPVDVFVAGFASAMAASSAVS